MIPDVPRERIIELAKRIKPLYVFNRVPGICFIKPVDPFDIAYTWAPEREAVAPEMPILRDITTYHTFGYYGFFKPTIAEVLAQIPDDIIEQAKAFLIIAKPEMATDLHRPETNLGFHVATTRIFG